MPFQSVSRAMQEVSRSWKWIETSSATCSISIFHELSFDWSYWLSSTFPISVEPESWTDEKLIHKLMQTNWPINIFPLWLRCTFGAFVEVTNGAFHFSSNDRSSGGIHVHRRVRDVSLYARTTFLLFTRCKVHLTSSIATCNCTRSKQYVINDLNMLIFSLLAVKKPTRMASEDVLINGDRKTHVNGAIQKSMCIDLISFTRHDHKLKWKVWASCRKRKLVQSATKRFWFLSEQLSSGGGLC